MNYPELVKRVKAAIEPSQELDVLIAKYVDPKNNRETTRLPADRYVSNRFGYEHSPPRYTASLDDALKLIPKNCDIGTIGWDPSGNACKLDCFTNGEVEHVAVGYAVTLPLAVALASLKAREILHSAKHEDTHEH